MNIFPNLKFYDPSELSLWPMMKTTVLAVVFLAVIYLLVRPWR